METVVSGCRKDLGLRAGQAIAAAFRTALASKESVATVFAAAPSQNETLEALSAEPGIDWSRVTAFHMDEYVGAKSDSSYSFRKFLNDRFFSKVPVAVFHQIHGEAMDRDAECRRYTELIPRDGFDIALLGIGENGHLAFNDPPCDFNDPESVKIVSLDEACRHQQVHDGAFAKFDDVPTHAFTLTVPALMRSREAFVMVPGPTKAEAVRAAVEGPLTEMCPASILRKHPQAMLFLDTDSANLLSR